MKPATKTNSGPCTKTRPCEAMSSRLEQGESRQGFMHGETLNFKTGKVRYIGIIYRKPKLPPIILNFCPWCGASVNFAKKRNARAAELDRP